MKEPSRPSLERIRALWRAARRDGCTAVPDFGFTACCDSHDRDYGTGHDESGRKISRLRADWRLFLCMLRNKKKSKITRALLSPVFFIGVRLLGWTRWKTERQKINSL